MQLTDDTIGALGKIAGLITLGVMGVFGVIGWAITQRRARQEAGKPDLGQAQAEFFDHMLNRLKDIEAEAKECRQRFADCEEHNHRLSERLEAQDARIAELEAALGRAALPTPETAPGTA